MPRVTVQPPTWGSNTTTAQVNIRENGDVFYGETMIGTVALPNTGPPLYAYWGGPRTARSSRKTVWFGRIPGRENWVERDTRTGVLRELLTAANVAGYGNRS